MKKSKKVISLTEAAKLSEYNQDYLGSLIRKGEIKGEKIGRSYFTTEEEIKNFLFKQKIPDKKPTVRDFFSRHYTSTIFVNALTILVGFSLIGFYIWSIGNNKPKISTTTTPDATNISPSNIAEEIPEPAVIPPAVVKEDATSSKIITIRGPAGPAGPQGPQGPAGPQGIKGDTGISTIISAQPSGYTPLPAVVLAGSITQPNPVYNYSGGSIFSATDLSATNFITDTAKIGTLTVSGDSAVTGGLNITGLTTLTALTAGASTITGTSTFNGPIVLSNTFSQTGANTFSTGTGAICFASFR